MFFATAHDNIAMASSIWTGGKPNLWHKIWVSEELYMARPLRIEYPDAFYHITSRGNERKDTIIRQTRLASAKL
jgi:hypothetical protein